MRAAFHVLYRAHNCSEQIFAENKSIFFLLPPPSGTEVTSFSAPAAGTPSEDAFRLISVWVRVSGGEHSPPPVALRPRSRLCAG